MLEWLASTRVPDVACCYNEQEAGIYNRWIEPFIVRVDCANRSLVPQECQQCHKRNSYLKVCFTSQYFAEQPCVAMASNSISCILRLLSLPPPSHNHTAMSATRNTQHEATRSGWDGAAFGVAGGACAAMAAVFSKAALVTPESLEVGSKCNTDIA
jgi:hypothetical protein